ncbi:hypothetical protein Tco_1518361, partial [Tanacetum coccineum]
VEEFIWMKFVLYAVLEMEIQSLMIQIRILSIILQIFLTTLHNPNTNHTRTSYVEMILTMVMIVHHDYRLGPHESFQCQPWHQHYSDLNPCYDSNSYNFDQPDHQPQIIHEDQSLLILVLILLKPSRHYNYKDDDDDDEEFSIPLNKMPQILRSIALAPISSIMEPEDSLSMGDEHLSTIPEKESNEFIKTSVKDLVLIPSESEDTSESDNNRDLPLCDNFSPINVYEEKSMTFSNPLFDSNDDFTSSDDE